MSRILVLALAILAGRAAADARLVSVPESSSLAPMPRAAVPGRSLPPSRTVVRICYTDDTSIAAGCRSFVDNLRACGLDVLYLENPSVESLREKLKGLPPNTNVSIASHGLVSLRVTDGPGARHHLTVPRGIGIRPEDSKAKVEVPFATLPGFWRFSGFTLQRRVNLLSTKRLLDALDGAIGKDGVLPSKYVGACHSGEVCDEGVRCTAAACRADEKSYMYDAMMEDQERTLAHLMCFPEAFRRADTNGNGVLESREIAALFEGKQLPRQRTEEGDPTPQHPVWGDFVLYPTAPVPPGGFGGALRRAVTAARLGHGGGT